MIQKLCLLAIVLATRVAPLTFGSEKIQRNPFARPPLNSLVAQNPAEPVRESEEWRPELRALLVAGQKSVADLGGLILLSIALGA